MSGTTTGSIEQHGHLFQDRFRSENVETNKYLLTVIRYIHQNPVKAGIVNRLMNGDGVAVLGYYGKKHYPKNILDFHFILKMISNDIRIAKERFKEFNERQNHDQCLEDKVSASRLSDEEARMEIKSCLVRLRLHK